MPTARSRPISRVRSKIDSARVLPMPSSAMTIARREQGVDQGQHLVQGLGYVGLGNSAWSMHRRPRVRRGGALDRGQRLRRW